MPTQKIKIKTCRYCILAGDKTCNYDNDIYIEKNLEQDTLNESCPLKEQNILIELK